jgi:hypothetical protein
VLCPDGKQLNVSGSTHELAGPWGFKVRLRQQSGTTVVHTAAVGSFEAVQRHTARLAQYTKREVRFRGQALVSYEDPVNSFTTFLWGGRHHELYWTVGGRDVSFEAFAATVSTVELADSPDGLLLAPKRGAGGTVALNMAANTLTGLCALTVMPIEDSTVSTPKHAGKRVDGGIMWRTDQAREDGSIRRTAVIAGGSAVANLGFFEPDSPANMRLAESIQVSLS